MMQKMVDLERTNSFSSSTLITAPAGTTMMFTSTSSPIPPAAAPSSLLSSRAVSPTSTDSTDDSSALNSPLSPTEVQEEIMLRAAASDGSGGGNSAGRSSTPFPFSLPLPSIIPVSPDPKHPTQFLMGLGMQILEGRLPDHKQAKGFVEGEHIPVLFKNASHFCDFETNPLCRQLVSLQLLLMSNPSTFILEVSVIPKHGISNNITNEYNTSSSPVSSSTIGNNHNVQNEMLIERWKITVDLQEENEVSAGVGGVAAADTTTGRGGGALPIMMTPRNLHNAIRSFLHFSQLAAWLSKKKKFTSAWKVKIDIGESIGGGNSGQQTGSCGGGGVRDGWDRHEFPAVTLESHGLWDSQQAHNHQYYSSPSPNEKRWSKGRSNSKWIVKVAVDSLPRMENFPLLLPVPGRHNNANLFHHRSSSNNSTAPTNHSITTISNTTTAINKPRLSSSASSSSPSSILTSFPSTSSSSSSLAISSHATATTTGTSPHHFGKSQQQILIYGGVNARMMLGQHDENASDARIRFRGGRSRRTHTSGGNNGSSSHRSRPKNLRIAIPDVSPPYEEDADIDSFSISSSSLSGSSSSGTVTTFSSASATATKYGLRSVISNDALLFAGNVYSRHHNNHLTTNNNITSIREKQKFESSLNRAATLVFHKSGLPLTSSPAPIRRSGVVGVTNVDKKYGNAAAAGRFDFDSSLLPKSSRGRVLGCPHFNGQRLSAPSQSLLGSFEESVLNGRIEPVSTVEGFTAEVDAGTSHNFKLPVTVFFYTFCDNDRVSSPYSAHVTLSPTVYPVPRRGTLQVTLYNPMKTVVKMFVINYDLSQMEANSQTFIRQKILFMPLGKTDTDPNARKWLRYLIHLRFGSSPNGDKIYLHKDIRMIVLQKSDADTAAGLASVTGGSVGNGKECSEKNADLSASAPYELRSFTYFADAPPTPSKQCG